MQRALLNDALGVPPGPAPADPGGAANEAHALLFLRTQAACQAAAAFTRRAEQPGTLLRRRGVAQEFLEWSATVVAGFQPSLVQCTAVQLLTFLHEAWHPRHQGATLDPATGVRWASPGYLSHAVSQLATAMRESGMPDADNPGLSYVVGRYLRGYRQSMYQLGYRESSAVPVAWDDLLQVLRHLDARMEGQPLGSVERAVLARDAAASLYLWVTLMRGREAGEMKVSGFRLMRVDCCPAWDLIVRGALPAGVDVTACPELGTKSVRHPDLVWTVLTQRESRPVGHCLLWRLQQLALAMDACGFPLVDYVFRPLVASDHRRFQSGPLSAPALNKRLQFHLQALGLWCGQTAHGVKRGRMQHEMFNEARSLSDISHGRHRSESTTMTYVNPIRHARRYVAGQP